MDVGSDVGGGEPIDGLRVRPADLPFGLELADRRHAPGVRGADGRMKARLAFGEAAEPFSICFLPLLRSPTPSSTLPASLF